ncbi:MAG TPA: ABC transporter permease [Acidimicrobiia bacterium]|nr:ABC transporter permease [Acidimicrobiia bacterium]
MSSPSFSLPASGRVGKAIEYLQDLWRRREFAMALGLGNLKARNASTSLGLFWWVLNPLLLGGVYFLVFGLFFQRQEPTNFLVYLLSGMFPFHFTSQSMTGGANSIIQNAKLLANLRFPRLLLPISAMIEALVGFLASLVVLVLIILIAGTVSGENYFTFRLAYLPLIIPIHLVFNIGLGAMTARLAVPFRDINNLLPYVNRIWLYLTPIIWPLELLDGVSPFLQSLVRLNPMFDIVGLYRSALLGTPLVLDHVVGALIWASVIGVVGVAVFVRHEGHIVRYL